jgi:hypothetical protein
MLFPLSEMGDHGNILKLPGEPWQEFVILFGFTGSGGSAVFVLERHARINQNGSGL